MTKTNPFGSPSLPRRLLTSLIALSLAGAPLPMAHAEETTADLVVEQTDAATLAATDAPVLTEAQGAVLLDAAGNVLFEKNPELELPPASTTKIMTAMCIMDCGKPLSDIVTCQEVEVGDDAQMADYGAGDQVSLGELMLVMLVYSANDAAAMAAIHIDGSIEAFCDRMNAKAAELGMTHTHFVNPHGYEADNHYSCARDLAIMGRAAMRNYPLIAQAVLLTEVGTTVRGERTVLGSTDRLLRSYPGTRGVKTGAIANSYTFVGAVGNGAQQLYSAVAGCSTWSGRFQDTTNLFDWAFAHRQDQQLSTHARLISANPFAYDCGLRVALSDAADTVGKRSTIVGDGLSRISHIAPASSLATPGHAMGWRETTQANNTLGRTVVSGRPRPVRLPALDPFTLPLFASTQTAGEL